jgi:hypothetical protein
MSHPLAGHFIQVPLRIHAPIQDADDINREGWIGIYPIKYSVTFKKVLITALRRALCPSQAHG